MQNIIITENLVEMIERALWNETNTITKQLSEAQSHTTPRNSKGQTLYFLSPLCRHGPEKDLDRLQGVSSALGLSDGLCSQGAASPILCILVCFGSFLLRAAMGASLFPDL